MTVADTSSDPRAVRSRDAIRSALVDLLADHRLGAISARQLAVMAKVGNATVFRHYDSVNAVVFELTDPLVVEFADMLEPLMTLGKSRVAALVRRVSGGRHLSRRSA